MAKKAVYRRKARGAKRNIFDPVSFALGKYLSGQKQVDRFVRGSNPSSRFYLMQDGPEPLKFYVKVGDERTPNRRYVEDARDDANRIAGHTLAWKIAGRPYGSNVRAVAEVKSNPAEDISFLNDLAPETSRGHIEFETGGIERFARDGVIYRAFTATPVFPDGYRVGAPEGYADFDYPMRVGGIEGEQQFKPAENPFYITQSDLLKRPEAEHAYNQAYDMNFRKTGSYAKADAAGTRALLAWAKKNQLIVRNPRCNPAPASDAVYTEFHGAPPSEVLEITETEHVHGHLAGIGDLVSIVVKLSGGTKVGATTTLTAPDPETASDTDIVHVASNESSNQLYLVGGDQSVDVEKLGFRDSFDISHDGETFEATELKDLMILGEIQKLTYRTQKSFDNFKLVDYFHKLGEDTRVRPFLLYDTLNDRMRIAGGEYHIHDVGIVN